MHPEALRRSPEPNIAQIAALVGDPTRAAMLLALAGGVALSASELAFRGGASAPSASAHLRRLADGGLVTAVAAGRQRLYRLTSTAIGEALEALLAVAPPPSVASLSQSLAAARLRDARTCYDHLAGRLGVGITDGLLTAGRLRLRDGAFHVPPRGERFLASLGIDLLRLRTGRRVLARPCMDWTERRPHLAGSLGAALLESFLTRGWVTRRAGDRSVALTEQGLRDVPRLFGAGAVPPDRAGA